MIHAWDDPIKETGHIQILRGNLAPDGCVAKITGKEGLAFSGTAIAFDSEEDDARGARARRDPQGPRDRDPLRGAARRARHARDADADLGDRRAWGSPQDVALITDGRFSGGSHGFIIGHVTPEAQDGGPIALVRDGDRITIDAKKRVIELEVSDAELAQRRAAWTAPPLRAQRGTLAKYIRSVRTASEGCVTDE